MKISVCIPTYNGEKYIAEQLYSILPQLSKNDEVIISDDSSTDQTVEIIRSIGDHRIIILEDNHFSSPIYNLENALRYSTGDVIFLSDQDDIWMPTKVEELVKLLKIYDCVVSDAVVVDKNKNVISTSFMELNNSKSGLINNIIKNGFLGCCMAFNRKILDRALPFPVPIPMHDTWIGLIAEKYGKTYFIRKPLICYRRHGENASPTAEKSRYSLLRKLWNRWLFLKNIILR